MFTYFRILNEDFVLYSAKLRAFLINLSLLNHNKSGKRNIIRYLYSISHSPLPLNAALYIVVYLWWCFMRYAQ